MKDSVVLIVARCSKVSMKFVCKASSQTVEPYCSLFNFLFSFILKATALCFRVCLFLPALLAASKPCFVWITDVKLT